MPDTILITGSEGLIGTALCELLAAQRTLVRRFDLKKQLDVCEREVVRASVEGCTGIIHLAAVSRVIWGEREPERCWQTNVEGTRNILQAAAASARKPWVIFASSREVYGHAQQLPATEDAPLAPCNVYGRTKLAGRRGSTSTARYFPATRTGATLRGTSWRRGLPTSGTAACTAAFVKVSRWSDQPGTAKGAVCATGEPAARLRCLTTQTASGSLLVRLPSLTAPRW